MSKEPEIVGYEIADKTGKIVATGEAGSKDVVIPNLTPNTDYAKGDYKGRKIDPAGEWKSSDYLEIEGFKTKPIVVTGVSLDNTTLSLETGKTATLKATVTQGNATNKAVSWSSDTAGVATVDNNGKVTAVKVGTAKITVKTTDGAKTATCTVTVKDPVIAVTGVTLDKESATIDEGATVQLKATVVPANATDKTITWKSGNAEVASVDSNGKVTGLKDGMSHIVVTTKDGSKTAQSEISVKGKAPEPDPEPSEPETPPEEG